MQPDVPTEQACSSLPGLVARMAHAVAAATHMHTRYQNALRLSPPCRDIVDSGLTMSKVVQVGGLLWLGMSCMAPHRRRLEGMWGLNVRWMHAQAHGDCA